MLRGLPHNVTTEMDLALWDVANRIRTDPAAAELMRTAPTAELVGRFHAGTLPPVAAEAVAGFLARYGERAVAEIDLGLPRWSEDPAHVLGVIANYLRLDDPALAPDALFAKGAAEAEQTIDALSRRAGGLRGRVVRFALGRARSLAGLREPVLHGHGAGRRRAQLVAVGAELTQRGRLASPHDVFFLTLAEVRKARSARARHPASRGVRPRAAAPARPQAPALRRHRARSRGAGGRPGGGRPDRDPGLGGHGDRHREVVLDPVGAQLEPGEILVCPSTDPGGPRCSSPPAAW